MIYVTFSEGTAAPAFAQIPSEFGPALRSALEEMRNLLGERAAGASTYAKEDATVRAINGLAPLAAAFNRIVSEGDPDYE